MACTGEDRRSVESVVQAWSSGNTSVGTDLFFPATDALPTIDWGGGKVSLEVQATSGAAEIEVTRYYQLSNDQLSRDAPVAMTTDTGAVSALGFDYGTAGTTTPLTKRFIRFGIRTHQKTGTAIEQIRVRVLLDRDVR